jgi:general stress protein 26
MLNNINEKQEAIKKLKEMVEEVRICMFATIDNEYKLSSRPMASLQVDEEGNIWFFTNEYSGKVNDVSRDNTVYLLYAHPGKNTYVHVKGTCTVLEDRNKVEELWNPAMKVWFPEGKDDPKLCMLKVDSEEASYWDSSSNKLVVFARMLKTLVTGDQPSMGETGELKVGE